MSDIICNVCFHHCRLEEGGRGFCGARMNRNGENICENYGRLTSLAVDPIEKKPLAHFYPGSRILSIGSYGCNLACPFCQNYTISQARANNVSYRKVSAEDLVNLALSIDENLGIAFTYNEPLIAWELIRDVGKILHEKNKKVVVVTNGTASQEVIDAVIPWVDAMNIDLKGDENFYKELHGDYQMVKSTIKSVCCKCHLEITSLIIPGKNDNIEWIRCEAEWLASLDDEIVLHLTRYFPAYHSSIPITPRQRILALQDEARKYLKYVYTGNM